MIGINASAAIKFGLVWALMVASSGMAVANPGVSPAEPGAAATNGRPCDPCAGPIRGRDAALVIATPLADGGYVAVWQSTSDSRVYGQCYTQAGLPRGAQFRINAEVTDGILPVMIPQDDGSFVATWKQNRHRFEQHFTAYGVPLEDATLRK